MPTAEATRRQYSNSSSNVCVARRVEVHGDAVDHVLERLPRQVERRDERLQAAGPAASRRSARRSSAPAPRARSVTPPAPADSGRCSSVLVHRVVHGPAEVPDGDDGARRWSGGQDEKRIVESSSCAPSRPPRLSSAAARHEQRAARRSRRASAGSRAGRRRAAFDPHRGSAAAEPGQPQLEPQPAADAVAHRPAVVESGARDRRRTARSRRVQAAFSRPPDTSSFVARRTVRARRAAHRGGRRASRGRSPARNSSAAAPCSSASDDRSSASSR